jgi:DNA-binding Lrp family transcriptional regulator
MRNRAQLDRLDFKILEYLQSTGRCSNVELANAVGLSPSPCLARVKRLQRIGVIDGFGAHLAMNNIGNFLIIFAEVTLSNHRKTDLKRFETAAAAIPEIIECYNVSGGYDFLIKVAVQSVAHFHNVMDEVVEDSLKIKVFRSYVVLRVPFIKHEYPLSRLFEYE